MSMPVPAISQAMIAPSTPVSCAKRRGSEKTPAPTIEPTTIAVMVTKVSFAGEWPSVIVVLSAIAVFSSALECADDARQGPFGAESPRPGDCDHRRDQREARQHPG